MSLFKIEITETCVYSGATLEVGEQYDCLAQYGASYKVLVNDTARIVPYNKAKRVDTTINPNAVGSPMNQYGAVGMLQEASDCIGNRASERDTEAERSMAATIRSFNGMFGTELTEEQGWHFMALLKMARAKGGEFRRDDYVDGAAYFALAGECRGDY